MPQLCRYMYPSQIFSHSQVLDPTLWIYMLPLCYCMFHVETHKPARFVFSWDIFALNIPHGKGCPPPLVPIPKFSERWCNRKEHPCDARYPDGTHGVPWVKTKLRDREAIPPKVCRLLAEIVYAFVMARDNICRLPPTPLDGAPQGFDAGGAGDEKLCWQPRDVRCEACSTHKNNWEIIVCEGCMGAGMHVQCLLPNKLPSPQMLGELNWQCEECKGSKGG